MISNDEVTYITALHKQRSKSESYYWDYVMYPGYLSFYVSSNTARLILKQDKIKFINSKKGKRGFMLRILKRMSNEKNHSMYHIAPMIKEYVKNYGKCRVLRISYVGNAFVTFQLEEIVTNTVFNVYCDLDKLKLRNNFHSALRVEVHGVIEHFTRYSEFALQWPSIGLQLEWFCVTGSVIVDGKAII
jgi:hypothetical protein